MLAYPIPNNELERLEALARYEEGDSSPTSGYQEIVELTSQILGTSASLISLIHDSSQTFRAVHGLDITETPRSDSPCAHAIMSDDIFEISDLLNDPRFSEKDFVQGSAGLRFYAGMPLRTHDGFALGTLCVFDKKPRALTEPQRTALRVLSKQVMNNMELQFQMRMLAKTSKIISDQNKALTEAQEKITHMNQELREMNSHLECMVAKRTQELHQKNTELDTFLYRSSHDLMRPVTSMQGLAMIAAKTLSNEDSLALFERVAQTADGMKTLLAKLLQAHTVLSSNHTLHPVDLESILEEVHHDVQRSLSEAKWMLNLNVEDGLQVWQSNPTLLRILFSNLFENAWYFRNRHQVPVLKITAHFSEDAVEIHIEDNGMGMLPEAQERCFEMFFRGAQESKGNGLGLYLVDKVTKHLNGQLQLSSVPGHGSTFTLRFPLSPSDTLVTHSSFSTSSVALASAP